MRIENRMTPDPSAVQPSDFLSAARKLMDAGGFRRVPVLEGGKLVGILSERDLRGYVGYLDSTKVSAVMIKDPITLGPDATAEDAAQIMVDRKIGGIPIVENGKLIGIITTTDVLKAFLDVERATQGILNES